MLQLNRMSQVLCCHFVSMAKRGKKRRSGKGRRRRRQRGKGIPGASLAAEMIIRAAHKASTANWHQTKASEFKKAYYPVISKRTGKVVGWNRRKNAKGNYDRDYGFGKW